MRHAKEAEITGIDGTVRKAHYGEGKQPWDTIKELGWGPGFAAGNVLKYVRRHAAKNGEDDLDKARWYFAELQKLQKYSERAQVAYDDLCDELTRDEFTLVRGVLG